VEEGGGKQDKYLFPLLFLSVGDGIPSLTKIPSAGPPTPLPAAVLLLIVSLNPAEIY
jgi:hypothetical protein